jgi:hypothetical protein
MRKASLYFIASLIMVSQGVVAQKTSPIYSSPAYSIYADRVVQGKNIARAQTPTSLTSDYRSPANQFASTALSFKFSINGKDNEMASGKDHLFYCTSQSGSTETPLIRFGTQLISRKPQRSTFLKPGTRLKIRLDMRHVLHAFEQQGYYITPSGDKVYKTDFNGVYVAGGTAPLNWDFNNLVNHPNLQLKDPEKDGIYETVLVLNNPADVKKTASNWKLSLNISAFPSYNSAYPLSDALYNLSLEEMQRAVEPDSTFRTGKEWSGVWTRDISYSIILSMAVLQPKVAMYSLMRKVKDGRVIQDTGTGGAYPVSSDRMIWAVAAWEVYKVTGDRQWLKQAYAIIRKSAADDVVNVYDRETGLVRGESSFLDWREQTYPKWMQPADIFESECLGTNAVHYQVNKVLAAMAASLQEPAAAAGYLQKAEGIRKGIDKYLWQADKGYYAQYLYGRYSKITSPRSEALGEALSVLFDVAAPARQKLVVSRTPVTSFGIPCIYPQIPDILPYHNNATWPFVESFWALAAAKVGNEASVLKSISAIYRSAAMFLTNKENFVSNDGDFAGTQINSSNMLWSLSGNIAIVYKILFGIQYNENSMVFHPLVPKALAGKRTLENYPYRKALLSIEMEGYGNRIASILMDGVKLQGDSIPANLKGSHKVKIKLADNKIEGKINMQPDYTSPATPDIRLIGDRLTWKAKSKAASYRIIINGKLLKATSVSSLNINRTSPGSYQIEAVDQRGGRSFASEPILITPAGTTLQIEAELYAPRTAQSYAGFSGSGFVNVSTEENTHLKLPVVVSAGGDYLLELRYANGNGPINTENKCAIRTLKVDGRFAGTIVLPQRGKDEWSEWGFSNAVKIHLAPGKHVVEISMQAANANMNGIVNQAVVDYLRVSKM